MYSLGKISIFESLSPSELSEIEPYFSEVNFKKRQTVFSEGDPSDWLYVVLDGKVKITKVSHDGKEIIVEVIQPMEFFGGIAVVRGFPYPANAVVMEDARLLRLSKTDLMRILDGMPTVMYSMAQSMGERIRDSHAALKSMALERVESRIASLLMKLSAKVGTKTQSGIAINMKLTKQDLSEMVGTTVETAIRVMSKLKKQGMVSEQNGVITICDADKLSSL